jgi:hypothetical protein
MLTDKVVSANSPPLILSGSLATPEFVTASVESIDLSTLNSCPIVAFSAAATRAGAS